MGKTIVSILYISAILNVSTAAFAHEQEEWNPPSAGPITAWTAPLCGKGKFVAQPFFFYNRTRGAFDSKGNYDSLPEGDWQYQYQQIMFMQYGITDKLEVDTQLTYQESLVKQGELKARSNGRGDTLMFLRYCALEEAKFLPHVSALAAFRFPTGKYQKLDPDKLGTDSMGTGSYDQGFGVNLTKRLKPFIFHADAIYSFSQPVKVDGVKTRYANYLNYDFGVEYFLPRGFNLMLEFNGFLQDDRRDDGQYVPSSDAKYLVAGCGAGWSNSKIQTLLAYQRTLAGSNTDANDSVILTLVYTF